MADNIIDIIKSYLSPEIIQRASSLTDESSNSTQKAMDAIIPTLLAGQLHYSCSSENGATRLFNLVSKDDYGNLLNNLSSILQGGSSTQNLLSSGGEILNTLFGGKLGSIINLIANFSGIKNSSASTLLSLAAPLILGVLGREKKSQGLGAAGLTSLLLSQRSAISNIAPTGLASALGLRSLGDLCSDVTDTTKRAAPAAVKESSQLMRWLLPLLVLCLLGALLYYLRGPKVDVTRKLVDIKLPGGGTLNLLEGSFNYNLAGFLADQGHTRVPTTFVFDNLNFEFGTTQLTKESVGTVDNLISILKAYPSSEVVLAGHTDNVGDDQSNKQLSQDRADAVRNMMVAGGINANRVNTAGYGEEKPVASNDTEEGRAKNRRLELVVMKK